MNRKYLITSIVIVDLDNGISIYYVSTPINIPLNASTSPGIVTIIISTMNVSSIVKIYVCNIILLYFNI